MNPVLQTIFETQTVHDRSETAVPLAMHTSEGQCRFLQSFIEKENVSTALEIGLAYGVSALSICESLAKKKNPRFISIDCVQDHWKQIGLANLERAGFDKITDFYPEWSHEILPKLQAGGVKLDFAYSDSSKVFDVVMVDAAYIIQMLRVGGYIAFDDCGLPGIRKVVRYLAKWPHLKVAGAYSDWPLSFSFKRRALCLFAKLFPRSLRSRIFRDDIVETDFERGVDGNCVVFKKIGEDERPGNWKITP